MRAVSLILLLVACGRDRLGGTLVGNPGKAAVTLGRVEALELQEATVDVAELTATRCSGRQVTTALQVTLDLLEPEPLELAAGGLCEIDLRLAGPVHVVGSRGGVPIDDRIPAERVVLRPTGTLEVDGESFVLELGGDEWLPVAPEGRSEGAAERIETGSVMYRDSDEDGAIDDEERKGGLVASADVPEAPDEPTGDDNDDDEDNGAEEQDDDEAETGDTGWAGE